MKSQEFPVLVCIIFPSLSLAPAIPSSAGIKLRAIYTKSHVIFFLDEQPRLSLYFCARLIISFVYDSVKVADSF